MRKLTFTAVRDFSLRIIALILTGNILLMFFTGLFVPESLGSIPMIKPPSQPAIIDYPRLCGLIIGALAMFSSMTASLLFLNSYLRSCRWWVSLIVIIIATVIALPFLDFWDGLFSPAPPIEVGGQHKFILY